LNHSGRYGSRAGNTLGVFSVLYSLYEGLFDYVRWFKYNRCGRWRQMHALSLDFLITARFGKY
jgi:hypothetical protein